MKSPEYESPPARSLLYLKSTPTLTPRSGHHLNIFNPFLQQSPHHYPCPDNREDRPEKSVNPRYAQRWPLLGDKQHTQAYLLSL